MKCDLCLKVVPFNLKYTLECGQCFRWKCVEDDTYVGVISDRVIKIKQEDDNVYIWSNVTDDLELVVREYFDFNKNYSSIEKTISEIDENIHMAVKNTSGIRILNQPLFETYISYIISANNNIKRISKSVEDISKMYGKKVQFEGVTYYLFPTLSQLKGATVEELQKCGLGFRAKYVVHNLENLTEEKLAKLRQFDIKMCKEELLTYMGIGPKVADCIMLFSLGKSEVFPIDVWVKRIMERIYFKEDTCLKDISEYAKINFKENSGIIQQHLFYNVREGKM